MTAPSASLAGRAVRAPRQQVLSNGVLGMLIFVLTEVMLFAGMISAHAIAMGGATEWPPANQPRLPILVTLLNTVVLLVSGGMLVWAQRTWRREPKAVRPPLFGALSLGVFFVLVQGWEWIGLIQEGLTLTSSTYGGFFYMIVGAHALHAVTAILALAWVWRRLAAGRLTESQFATVAIFWYFVVLVWPFIYLRIYQ